METITLQEDIIEQDYLPKVLKWLISEIIQNKEMHGDILIHCAEIHQQTQQLSADAITQLIRQKTASRDLSLKKSSLHQLWIDYYTDICVLEQRISNKAMQACKEKLLSYLKNNKLNYYNFSQSLR